LAAGPLELRREESCVTTNPERCFDARDDNCNGLIDEGCGVETGAVQFIIAWEEASADVDLLVTDPRGELAEPGRLTQSGLTSSRNCPGANAECNGQNYENVYLEGNEPLPGRYEVRVRLDELGEARLPLRVTLGARVGSKSYVGAVVLPSESAERKLVFELR
jgi:tRNA (guanosine-2'-O-)-methyltransferase